MESRLHVGRQISEKMSSCTRRDATRRGEADERRYRKRRNIREPRQPNAHNPTIVTRLDAQDLLVSNDFFPIPLSRLLRQRQIARRPRSRLDRLIDSKAAACIAARRARRRVNRASRGRRRRAEGRSRRRVEGRQRVGRCCGIGGEVGGGKGARGGRGAGRGDRGVALMAFGGHAAEARGGLAGWEGLAQRGR
jgi:hypothetical protein